MKKKTIIILLILTLSIYALNINVQSVVEENDYSPTLLELTPHDPISITSDSDFEVFPGLGTAEDPYIIEGYNITTTSQSGIYIYGTTKYFTIRNCYVDAYSCGIYIDDVADGTATVINNTCSNNNGYGIYLSSSGNSTVANNTCSYNNYGISLYSSGNSTVANNTFTNCGLRITDSPIVAYLSYTVENNWVNGKILGFYTNLDSTIIDEPVYGQLILVNCTDVTVRDQILNDASVGLFLYSCVYSVIINNTCNNNKRGIYLSSSGNSTVVNNTCNNNFDGIYLYSSSSSTVVNNTCSNNSYGIYLHSSDYSTVANSTCNNNYIGISLYSSSSSTVANNTCSNNNKRGISLHSSAFCVVTYNLLQENEGYGVYLYSDSDNNSIHHNNFVDNNLGGTSQAYDVCTNNTWYDIVTSEGNYWSDWSGTGNYTIDGDSNSVDLYPLDEPAEYSVESTTDENQLDFTFTILMLIVPLILTRIISKKVKK